MEDGELVHGIEQAKIQAKALSQRFRPSLPRLTWTGLLPPFGADAGSIENCADRCSSFLSLTMASALSRATVHALRAASSRGALSVRNIPVQSAGLHQSSVRRAITNMQMPAMSPTMTEGGIAQWKKQEGEAFAAGDVLLEIVRALYH